MNPIRCGQCCHPYHARPAGHFACPCGRVLETVDIDVDAGEVWTVDATGTLVYVTDPVRALDALTEAVEELRAAAGAPCPDAAVSYGLEGVVWAREQLAAAAALGIRLDPADIGPDGTIDGMDPGEWAAAMAME